MMIIAAMDTGSSFEGMGANREAFYSLLVEPAFFIVIASMALLTNHTSFYELFNNLHIESELVIPHCHSCRFIFFCGLPW